MTTRITITGTGTPIASAERAGPGALIQRDNLALQFDAGRATVMRLFGAGVRPADVDVVFLTHYHSDHLVGLQDLVLSHWTLDRHDDNPRLQIVAPDGPTLRYCQRMLDPWDADLAVRSAHTGRAPEPKVDLVGFAVPDRPTEVWRRGEVRVLAGAVRHEPVEGAVGYRIETPEGVVVISGDTLVCDEMATLAAGADVLVYEAIRMDPVMRQPEHLQFIAHYHADTRLIGRQAAALDVPTLLLTHLIPAPVTDDDKQAFVDEVREGGYRGEVVVCDDLTSRTLT
jgi:ribonuclease Z